MTRIEGSVQNKSPQTGERGVALIVALLAMVVISGLGFALLVSSSTESLINANFRRASLSYFSARGGLEEARGRLGPDAVPVGGCTAHTTPATACVPSLTTNIAIPCLVTDTDCLHLFDAALPPSMTNPNFNGGYYILLNTAINPTIAACTYLGQPGICTDPDPPSSPRYYLTSQPGTAANRAPYVWTKITLATQKKLKRRMDPADGPTPCNPIDPLDPAYCDPTTLDDSKMVCWQNQTSLALMDNTSQATRIASCGNPINPVYILTSLAIEPGTPTPTTRLVREVVAPGKIPGLPGPLTLDGIPAVYIPPTANPFEISGCDAASSAPCNMMNMPPHAPAVITPTDADRNAAHTLILDGNGCVPPGAAMIGCQPGNPNRNADYRGSTNANCSSPNCNAANNSGSIVSATDTSIFPMNPLTTNPYFADCAGLQSLESYIRAGADAIYTTTSPASDPNWDPGSVPNNRTVINVVDIPATSTASISANDLCTSPADCGAGILLVTGDLDFNGTPTYNGVIIVLGGRIRIIGGGNGTITGGIFVADTSTCPATLGPATFDPSGGGNLTIQYNSRWANPAAGWLPMQILSMN